MSTRQVKFYLEVKELLEHMKESGQYIGGMQKGIADILNVTKRQVAKYSAIEKLPFHIQQEVLEGKISINKAVEMAVPKKQDSDNAALLSDILSKLSDENRDKLLSGDIDLNTLIAHSQKDEPVHHFGRKSVIDKGEKKDEPVHHSGDILLYRGKQYFLNDVQLLEENDGYTMFKIMAIQQ